ncbi:MAG: heme lyase CcmF/NrfE family subunit [Devosiaceae bacterium]|nr:heme lyase CcmF/NrfE family subunit [Devosiaceae bacterium MH13]
MIVELGHYVLVLALVLAVVQSVLPFWGARTAEAGLMRIGDFTATVQFGFLSISFAALTYAYVVSDFSVLNVVQNSHSEKPMLFKVTGVWGNHEGSMLLWVLILGLFGAGIAWFGGNLPRTLKANVLSVQAWVTVAFLLFIILTSNPFERVLSAPAEGEDLNPILQDIGLAIHPPLLYLGYVGLSISFSFAIAALIEGRLDAAWARWVRPWTLAAWVFLTLGISMGSFWAYYELGWGGWWFWDPVENASFMPWLAATALLHSAIVMEKREALKIWTVLLAIIAFSLSLLGTFLVRSGVLTSVHAFATDPERGLFILLILLLFIGGGFALFAIRASELRNGGVFAPVSREGALVVNNLLLSVSTATVLLGTLYPLILEAFTGDKISVGPPFFNLTFGPLMIPLLIALPLGPLLAWKRGDLVTALHRVWWAAAASIVTLACVLALFGTDAWIKAVAIAVAAWVMLGAIAEPLARVKAFSSPIGDTARRLINLPRSAWGTTLAHFGVGVMVLGIVGVSAFESERITTVRPGDTVDVAGYEFTFEGMRPNTGPNYQEIIAGFTVREGGTVIANLEPSRRIYPARNFPTTEAGFHTVGFSQLYISPGDPTDDGGLVVRLYHKPLVTLIWIGTLIMSLGGLVSLMDRRLRIGAPQRAKRKAPAVPPGMEPAE